MAAKSSNEFVTRGEAIGFAQRTRKNLKYISEAFDAQEDLHVVTQLVNSLLGIVVVPKEQYFQESFLNVSLEELPQHKWPKWDITLDEPKGKDRKTETLKDLIRHLRNAAAHGRFTYMGVNEDQDAQNKSEIMIRVEDKYPKSDDFNWRCEIRGDELYRFCIRFTEYMEESIG